MKSNPMKLWWTLQLSCCILLLICSVYSLHLSSKSSELRQAYRQELLTSEPKIQTLIQDVEQLQKELKQVREIENDEERDRERDRLQNLHQDLQSQLRTFSLSLKLKQSQLAKVERRQAWNSRLNLLAVCGSILAAIRIACFNRSAAAEREQILQNQ